MKRPFLNIYWRSEAFLEMAKPLLELETLFENLPQAHLIDDLYQTLQALFGGRRSWGYYRHRMRMIAIAEKLASVPVEPTRPDQWSFATVLLRQSVYLRRKFIELFMEVRHPEVIEALNRHELGMSQIETKIKKESSIAIEMKEFCKFWKAVWSPIFRFRESLFPNLEVKDPHQFLLDEVGEVNLDPIHLLRFYEFASDGTQIELTDRAEQPFSLSFSLLVEDIARFEATKLCKLWAFEKMSIRRGVGDVTRPTALPESLQKVLSESLIPGVVVKEHSGNRWAIYRLRKFGLESYPIHVSSLNSSREEDYLFFPSLSGILAIATARVPLQSPDDTEFWTA